MKPPFLIHRGVDHAVAQVAGEHGVLGKFANQDLALVGQLAVHVEAHTPGILSRSLLRRLGVARAQLPDMTQAARLSRAVQRDAHGHVELGQELFRREEHGAQLVPVTVLRAGLLEQHLQRCAVQYHRRGADALHGAPEPCRREATGAQRARPRRQPRHHAIAQRVDVEHGHGSVDHVAPRVAHRVGDEAAQPDKVGVALRAELGAARSAGGVHPTGDVGPIALCAPIGRIAFIARAGSAGALGQRQGHLAFPGAACIQLSPGWIGGRGVGVVEGGDSVGLQIHQHVVQQLLRVVWVDERGAHTHELGGHPQNQVVFAGDANEGDGRSSSQAGCGELPGQVARKFHGVGERHGHRVRAVSRLRRALGRASDELCQIVVAEHGVSQ